MELYKMKVIHKERYFRAKNPSIVNFRQWLKRNFGEEEYHLSLDAGLGVCEDYIDYTVADSNRLTEGGCVLHYEWYDDIYYAFIHDYRFNGVEKDE